VVIHLAGAIGGRRRADFTAVNVDGTAALLAAVKAAAPEAFFLHVSSLAAREPQLSWYARSKRDGEVLVERAVLRWMIVRPPAVYGAHDPALSGLWWALARGYLLCPGEPDARFALTYVDDLVRALVAVVEQRPDERRILTIADARQGGYSWREVAAIAAQVRGAPVRIIRVPRVLLMMVAMLNLFGAWMLGRRPVLVPGKVRELAHRDWVCDNTLAALLEDVKPGRCLPETLPGLPGWQDQAGAKT
jgi:nucleoside-diphosphate-sugar epimerase